VILGFDWLTDNDAEWQFRNSRIKIGGCQFPLLSLSSRTRWCRRTVLQKDVVIPPRSEVQLPTRVVLRRPTQLDMEDCWATAPTCMRPGVYVSRTLVDDIVDVPVRVMNVRSAPVSLKAGTLVANLQQVKEVKPADVGRTTHDADEVPEFIDDLLSKVHESTPDDTRHALRELIAGYADVFSRSEYDLGLTNVVVHQIDTADARPVRQPLRRYPPAHVQAISEHVDTMLQQNVIEPACSPWASNIVLVRKRDGSLRCCIDYRQLNSATRKDAYPLPRIDACLDAMSNAQWFSTFDLRSSYHQVPVEPADRDKTAFICPRGMYRFKTMPFGLCNAGATFQRLMDVVMTGLHLELCLVYLDDIIVFSSSVAGHLDRLRVVLDRLRSAGLKLKPGKCVFLQKSVSFLGHVVSDAGISTDPEKTRAVAEWPRPTRLRDVRAFLGLASYYRRFVQNFSVISAPLHQLSRKNQIFHWHEGHQRSFDELKARLTTSPILAMPTDDGEFILDTDASGHAIGAVLSQVQDGVERVVAYASRTLDRREQNYCVTRRELLAVVHFIRYFKQYLLGRSFTVRTDHAALSWLRRTPDPIGQQARWLEIMEEYDFSVLHRSGSSHKNADAMSRMPCGGKGCVCNLVDDSTQAEHNLEPVEDLIGGPADRPIAATRMPDVQRCIRSHRVANAEDTADNITLPWSAEGLREAQRRDKNVAVILHLFEDATEQPPWDAVEIKSPEVKTLWGMWPRLSLVDGLLKRRFESADGLSSTWQVVLPAELRSKFIEIAHGGMTGGHLGRARTAATIQSRTYWPSWSTDLDAFLRTCAPCARYHRGSVKRQGPLQTPLVTEPWSRVSIDITGPHPKSSNQHQYILTLVDHFSKWAEALPIANHTAPTVARALMTNVFSRFGAPRQILSDLGTEFQSNLFVELLQWMEIHQLRTTPYKPSTNGTVERFHRTLNSMLGKVVKESQRDWHERLPLVMAAYRSTVHEATGFSPNRLFLGRETRMPLDVIMGLPADDCQRSQTTDQFVRNMQEQIESCYEIARTHLRAAAERRKATYDIKVRKSDLKTGDWVWYFYPRRYKSRSPKWQKHFVGPYLVVRQIEPVNLVLQKSERSKPFVVHVDKVKRCYGDLPVSWLKSTVEAVSTAPEALADTQVDTTVDTGLSQLELASDSPVSGVGVAADTIQDLDLTLLKTRTCTDTVDTTNTSNSNKTTNNSGKDVEFNKPERVRRVPAHFADFVMQITRN